MRVIAIALVLAACGDDGGTPPSDLVDDTVNVVCGKAFECMASYPGPPSDFTAVWGANEAGCVMQQSPPPSFQETLDASVAAGRIRFDADAARACNAFFDGLACDTTAMGFWGPYTLPASCEGSFVGTVKAGETCTFWTDDAGNEHDIGDCADPLECSPDTSTCIEPG